MGHRVKEELRIGDVLIRRKPGRIIRNLPWKRRLGTGRRHPKETDGSLPLWPSERPQMAWGSNEWSCSQTGKGC